MWPQIPAWKLPQVIWLHIAMGTCCGLPADLRLNPKVSVDTLGLSRQHHTGLAWLSIPLPLANEGLPECPVPPANTLLFHRPWPWA